MLFSALTTTVFLVTPLLSIGLVVFLLWHTRSVRTAIASKAGATTETTGELVETILNEMGDGVLLADLSGQLIYLNRAARRDLNVFYPLDRLRELVAAGRLGGLTAQHVSLMGHVEEHHLPTLTGSTAPQIAQLMRDQRADIVLLVPA